MKNLRWNQLHNVTEQRIDNAYFACSSLGFMPETDSIKGYEKARYINDTGGFYEITS